MPARRAIPTLSTSTPYGSGSIPPTQGLRLSRSPHPYHRRGSHGRQYDSAYLSYGSSNNGAKQQATQLMTTPCPPQEKGYDGANYFDADGRKRRKYSTSPSESGTEADDESGMLRGLPAPPFKSRKGIKDSRNVSTSSPLLTPTLLDDHEREFSMEDHSSRHGILQNQSMVDEERLRRRERFTRRRRAELLRRMTETVLIGSVGCIACGRGPASPFHTWKRGNHLV